MVTLTPRPRRLARVLSAFVLAALLAPAAGAQDWNDARARDLVQRAITLRQAQLADTGLVDYHATARGFLTFLAQLGEGFTEPPKIVKADELALDIYWKAPNLSRQRIVGRRDTLLLPTDINYHRDHLGIVQNNFPDIIRLGDGDEVLDVPHPLSPAGIEAYDYQVADSLRIRLPDRVLQVITVRVRPKDDRQPRAVGAVFIERTEAQVVRMAFSFTRSALKDEQLEDVSVVLENSLVQGRFWLPRRQEIEIRRAGTFLEYPARGIIRGRWEICCYEVNRGFPAEMFRGPEIVQAPLREQRAYAWGTKNLLDSLPPDVRAVTDEEVRAVQEEARALVRQQALARARRPALAARGVSDFLRVNRAEGLALGAGAARQLGSGLSAQVGGRWGFDDHEAKGRVAIAWRRASGAGVRVEGFRDYRDVSDEPETSLLRNTIAAQETGSDYTEPVDVRGALLAVDLPPRWGIRATLAAGWESHDSVQVRARPSSGRYEPTLPAWSLEGVRGALRLARPTSLSAFGTELRADAELRLLAWEGGPGAGCAPTPCLEGAGEGTTARAMLSLGIERPVGRHRLVLRTLAAGAEPLRGDVPPQELVLLGGPTTAPGYGYHELVGRAGASQRVEWHTAVPFVGVPLGRFGRAPATATLAPFAHVAWIDTPGSAPLGARATGRQGWHPSVGVGLLTLFDVVRFDVARGLRDGRWAFSVDVTRELWSVL